MRLHFRKLKSLVLPTKDRSKGRRSSQALDGTSPPLATQLSTTLSGEVSLAMTVEYQLTCRLPGHGSASDYVAETASSSAGIPGDFEGLHQMCETETLPQRNGRPIAVTHVPVPIAHPGNDPTFTSAGPEAHAIGDLWHEAFCQYHDIVGVDLKTDDSDLLRRFGGCVTYHDVVDILLDTLRSFKLYRNPDHQPVRARIRGALRDITRIVLSIGVFEVGGEFTAATVCVITRYA